MAEPAWRTVLVSLVAAGLVGAGGVLYGARIDEAKEYLNPKCGDTRGLKPIKQSEFDAQGKSDGKNYTSDKAIDGFGGSAWIPPMVTGRSGTYAQFSPHVPVFNEEPTESTLTLTYRTSQVHDVRLICVNNGLGNGDERFANWGKTRTVKVWTDDDESEAKTAVLRELPLESSASFQQLGQDVGTFSSVHLRLVDAFAGSEIITRSRSLC